MVDIELTPEQSAMNRWAEKHEVPRMIYDSVLNVVGRQRDFLKYLNSLYGKGKLPEEYSPQNVTRTLKGTYKFPIKAIFCNPLQAHLLEFNLGCGRF